MKLSAIFLLVLISSNLNAQNLNPSIRFSPLALFDDPTFPTIQGGFEFRLTDKISWYNELGIKYRKSIYEETDTNFIASGGFKLKTEIRYYTKKKKKRSEGLYFGVNTFFTSDSYNNEVLYYHRADSSNFFNDAFGVRKKVFGLNLIGGYQLSISKRFGVDFYGGIGFRYRIVHTIDEDYVKSNDELLPLLDENIDGIRQQIDADRVPTMIPNFTLGLRFYYKL